jgi:16S rRNA (cytosine967-C5)-methyltransferase
MVKPSSTARVLAAQAVTRVLRDKVTLDAALAELLAGADPKLAPAGRSLTYGAVRGYFRHQAILERLLRAPVKTLDVPVRALLSVALYEIEDARTPEYAVVDAAVETARATQAARAGGLINAVLRRYLRERPRVDAEVAANPATRHAAPQWLADRLAADWPAQSAAVLAALDAQAPLWLRVDARRSTAADTVLLLAERGIAAHAHAHVPFAVVLDTPCDVGDLPGFEQGLVSVQDLGAQCVAIPLALSPGQRILDACAAPGGKTALIAERDPGAQLVAVDIDASRLVRVRENLERGTLGAALIQGDAAAPGDWWDGVPFDRILLDAPCSALGVIRRHPDIRLRKSASDLEKLASQQSRLLDSLWPLLKPAGRLVYCTCTLTRRENHGVIAAFLRDTPDASVIAPAGWADWPPFGADDGLGRQILPGEAGADGFYYAALTKR